MNECLSQGHRPDQFRKSENAIYFAAGFMLVVIVLSLIITYLPLKQLLIIIGVVFSILFIIGILFAIAVLYCYYQFRNLTKDSLDLDLTPEDIYK